MQSETSKTVKKPFWPFIPVSSEQAIPAFSRELSGFAEETKMFEEDPR